MELPKGFFLLVIALLLILSVAMVLPFLQYFLLALLLAYLLWPIQQRLEERVSPRIAAGMTVLLATLTVVLPLVYLVQVAAREAVGLIDAIQEGEITLEQVERQIEEATGQDIDLVDELQDAVADVGVEGAVTLVDTAFHVMIGILLTVFLLYYFLKDGDKFMAWLAETVPVEEHVHDRMVEEFDQIMKAVLIGHVLVAIIQGTLAGFGLWVTGVPNAMLWTVVMIILSLLPIVGSFLVWGPAAIYLFLGEQLLFAGFLTVWGLIVVGVSDDYLRPIIVDRYAEVNPSVIIIGVLGGIYVFGVMGIFFGPVIIGLLRGALDVYSEEFVADEGGGGEAATGK